MGNPDPLRHTCQGTAYLPEEHVKAALDLAPNGSYASGDVERHLRCTLEEHTAPVHYGLVLGLDESPSGAVWATWDANDMAFALKVRHDCLAMSPDGSAICTEFDQHPGGHTWQLTDDPVYGTVFSIT